MDRFRGVESFDPFGRPPAPCAPPLRAISERCSGVSALALAIPPARDASDLVENFLW